MKKKGIAVCILAAVTALTVWAAYAFEINPPAANVAGAFAVAAAALLAAALVKIPDGLFYTGLLFIFFASPVGSVLNLYRLWNPYDKIVHFASGLLLAAAGFAVISWLLERAEADWSNRFVLGIAVLTAFLFAMAGAGLWEIFEFAADRIAGGEMQRGMVDTVTDMIAGAIGGLVYSGGLLAMHGKKDTNEMVHS